jgi:hypothetical protein
MILPLIPYVLRAYRNAPVKVAVWYRPERAPMEACKALISRAESEKDDAIIAEMRAAVAAHVVQVDGAGDDATPLGLSETLPDGMVIEVVYAIGSGAYDPDFLGKS